MNLLTLCVLSMAMNALLLGYVLVREKWAMEERSRLTQLAFSNSGLSWPATPASPARTPVTEETKRKLLHRLSVPVPLGAMPPGAARTTLRKEDERASAPAHP